MVIFVDPRGVADFRLPRKVRVGPILSEVGGYVFISAHLSEQEIRDKAGWEYYQPQIGK